MKPKNSEPACWKCRAAGTPRGSTKEIARKIAGRTFKGTVACLRCESCGEVLIDGKSMEAYDASAALELARTGAASPDALRFMRSSLGLGSSALAALLDLTPEHLSRVENGHVAADRRSVALLASMVLDQAAGSSRTLDQLRALGHPRKLSGTVRLPAAPTAAKVARRR